MLLLIPAELQKIADSHIELARKKRVPTEEDRNPNLRFVNNYIIKQLNNNGMLNRYCHESGISWANENDLMRKLFRKLEESDIYIDHMLNRENEYPGDKKFILKFYTDILADFEDLYQLLEEQSIYWNDEVDFTISMVIKTIKGFSESNPQGGKLIDLYKNDEDREFVKKLFRKVIVNNNDYREIIDEFTTNWELERIAFMDILLMEMAICELIEFPSIPTKVTLNEYIELSKFYSTKKSNSFINGVLDKIIHKYKQEKKIMKSGRGLMGENE
jgi:N utilization substance protein B